MHSPAFTATVLAIAASWLPNVMLHRASNLSVTVVMWGVAVLITLIQTLRRIQTESRFPTKTRRLYWLSFFIMTLIAVLAICSAQWSEEPFRVLRVVAAMAMMAAGLFTVPYCCQSLRQVHHLILACVIFGAIHALFLSVCVIAWNVDRDGWTSYVSDIYGRFMGGFKHPNQTGIALSCTIPLALAVMLDKDWYSLRWRQFAAAATMIMLMGLVATGSKANLLVSGLAILVMFASFVIQRRSFIQSLKIIGAAIGLISLATVLLAASLSVLSSNTYHIMEGLVQGDFEQIRAIQHRRIIWNESIEIGMRDPWRGTGAGSRLAVAGMNDSFSHSHNWLIDYFRSLGIPGLVLVTVLVGLLAQLAIHVSRSAQFHVIEYSRFVRIGVGFGLVAYLASNMSSDSAGPSTSSFLGIASGLCFALLVDPYSYLTPRVKMSRRQ